MSSALVGRGWTPEEAARREVALYRALALDQNAIRVYLQKVRVVESVRAKKQQATLPGHASCNTKNLELDKAAAGAGAVAVVLLGRLGRRLAPPRSPARGAGNRRPSISRASRSCSTRSCRGQSRCEAAAAKVGGSSPKVLARVQACCG